MAATAQVRAPVAHPGCVSLTGMERTPVRWPQSFAHTSARAGRGPADHRCVFQALFEHKSSTTDPDLAASALSGSHPSLAYA